MKILIIAAHPDDEVLGCGGIIRKYSKNGVKVYTLILTTGLSIRYKDGVKTDIRKAVLNCADILGVTKTFIKELPVLGLDKIPLQKIVKEIEEVLNEIKPDIVFTHNKGDINQDHKIVTEATLIALRPKTKFVKAIYSYEIPSSTDWITDRENIFIPNKFIDIGKELKDKIKAFKCYKSEIEKWPHSRSEEGLKALAEYRGMQSFQKSAEAFCLIRSTNDI